MWSRCSTIPSRSPPLKPSFVGGRVPRLERPRLRRPARCPRSGPGRSGRRPRRGPRRGCRACADRPPDAPGAPSSHERGAPATWARSPPLTVRPASGALRRRVGAGRGRAADDEPRREPEVLGQRLALLHLGEEEANRVGALLADRLVDRRQGRVDVGGEVDVVEADDAEVVGDAQARARGRRSWRRSPSRRSSRGRPSGGGPRPRPAGRRRRRPRSRRVRRRSRSAGELDRRRVERRAVAAQPARGDARARLGSVRRQSVRALRTFDGEDEDVAMAQRRAGAPRRPGRRPRRRRRRSCARAGRPSRRGPSAGRRPGSARPRDGRPTARWRRRRRPSRARRPAPASRGAAR